MTRLFSLLSMCSLIMAIHAQDLTEGYSGFKAEDSILVFEEVITTDAFTVDELLMGLTANATGCEEVEKGEAENEFIISAKLIDVHAHGLKNQSMPSQFLQAYYATVTIEVKEGRYKITASDIRFDNPEAKKKEEPTITMEELFIDEEGEPNRLGVGDKYGLDALAMDFKMIFSIPEGEELDDSDDW